MDGGIMKIKRANLEWYVMAWDFNYDAPYWHNIFTQNLVNTIAKCMKSKDSYWKIDSFDK